MRFHKVTAITSPAACSILDSAWVSLNANPVMNLFDAWFDIRRMTDKEVDSFTRDWMRSMAAEVRAGIVKPH
jgi:hypothetical protein